MKLSLQLFKLFCCCAALCSATLAQRSTGTISGQVIGDDGQPLTRATVTVVPANAGGDVSKLMSGRLAISTDLNGHFEVTGLDPAPYMISVRAPGYAPLQETDPNAAHYYFLGETATLTLAKGGVITGKVTTPNGDPVVGVEVRAISADPSKALVSSAPTVNMGSMQLISRQTDDRGVYRLYGVPPGKYVIEAGASALAFTASPFAGKVPTYHPAATRDAATVLTVQSGTELTGIDIRYRDERGFAISGKVTGLATGGGGVMDMRNATVVLLKQPGTEAVIASSIVLPVGGQNGYAFYGIPNGTYELIAVQSALAEDNQSAAAPRRVTVNNTDQTGVDLALAPLAAIKGQAVLEKAPANLKCETPRTSHLDELVLQARKDDPAAKPGLDFSALGANSPGVPNPQGAFTLRGLQPGRYRLVAQWPDETWYLKALTLPPVNPARDGVPVKAGEKLSGLTVTIGVGAASLQGSVKASGKLPTKLRVFLLPAEAEAKDEVLRYAETLVDEAGAFKFEHLAPGKYLVVARAVDENQAAEKTPRLVAWDTAERTKLRKEADAVNVVIELKACERKANVALPWK